jgi:MFS family permease
VNSQSLFYGLRLLLGFAEAGFFPGMILYLTYWFPSRRRGQMVALFMLAIALTGVIGAPLSGWILHQFNGVAGFKGWQMLFLLEGVPSIVIGLCIPLLLADGIRSATWLSEPEKQLLEDPLRKEELAKENLPLAHVFVDQRLIVFSMVYFCCAMGLYGTGFWIPQLIKNTGVKDPLDIGLLTAIPYGCGAISMVLFGRSSDRMEERHVHFAVASLLGAVGIITSNLFRENTLVAMIGLSIATIGILATFPLFWPMPTAMLGGTAAAAGIAWINSLGNLAGFFGPSIVGWITDWTKRSDYGLYVVAAAMILGAVLVLFVVPRRTIGEPI